MLCWRPSAESPAQAQSLAPESSKEEELNAVSKPGPEKLQKGQSQESKYLFSIMWFHAYKLGHKVKLYLGAIKVIPLFIYIYI